MIEDSYYPMIKTPAVSPQLKQHGEQWDGQIWGAVPAVFTLGMKDAAAGQGRTQPVPGTPQGPFGTDSPERLQEPSRAHKGSLFCLPGPAQHGGSCSGEPGEREPCGHSPSCCSPAVCLGRRQRPRGLSSPPSAPSAAPPAAQSQRKTNVPPATVVPLPRVSCSFWPWPPRAAPPESPTRVVGFSSIYGMGEWKPGNLC